ncbi:MAG: hypothetical protein KIT87_11850 [Anaerolineae bacterium]|nr:hypothetical protein [Anaerolineae bacterium]
MRSSRGSVVGLVGVGLLLAVAFLGLSRSLLAAAPTEPARVPGPVWREGQRFVFGVADRQLMAPEALAEPNGVPIAGQMVANAAPASGVSVSLRRYKGTADVGVLTTTTSVTGFYQFANPPVPPTGWTYYVAFGPNISNSAYVHAWASQDIFGYTSTFTLPINVGVINLADTPLLAPAPGATASFPVTFRWTARATTTDNYYVYLREPGAAESIGPGYPVGYTDSVTINDPSFFTALQPGRPYEWYIGINDSRATSSYGRSFEARPITFSFAQVATPTVTRTAAPPSATPTATRTATRTATVPAQTRTPTRTATAPAATRTPTLTSTPTSTNPPPTATPTTTPTRGPTIGDYALYLPYILQNTKGGGDTGP